MLSFVFGPLVWFKNYLSHVRETSWHYKLVHGIWGSKTSGKACTYYWFKFPSSILAFIGLVLLVVVFGFVLIVCSWFIGYTPTLFKTEDPFLQNWLKQHNNASYYPYGYTSRGKKRHIFPWQVTLGGGFLALVYYLGFVNQAVGLGVVSALGALIVLGIVVFVISKGWKTSGFRSARSAVGAVWDMACPPLEVIPAPPSGQTAETS